MAQAEVLNLESGAKQVLQETFGYQQFRPGQEAIIDTALFCCKQKTAYEI
nr:hypothetical protein [Acinetobacter baumannii]